MERVSTLATTTEAAALMGCCEKTIRRLMERGALACFRLDPNRPQSHLRFELDEATGRPRRLFPLVPPARPWTAPRRPGTHATRRTRSGIRRTKAGRGKPRARR
jgi:hypothetical protein